MRLVCGFSGVTSEQFRSIRKRAGLLGVSCKVGAIDGKVGFVGESLPLKGWESLMTLLKKEVGVIPMYFTVGKRIVSLEYGKQAIKSKHLPIHMYKPLKGILSTLVSGRVKYLNKMTNTIEK
jgi:hypothetical protein